MLAAPPSVEAPKVNGKTRPRSVSVSPAFAKVLHGWLYEEPLRGPESQWPFAGQLVEKAAANLFPGVVGVGQGKRRWLKAVSQRRYLEQVRKAAQMLQRERAEHRRAGLDHAFNAFDECSLAHTGTHSFKRTGVSLLKDQCRSTAVVASISGTSKATLEKVYDTPTRKRQREASKAAFDAVVGEAQRKATKSQTQKVAIKFCPRCGAAKEKADWVVRPFCGKAYGL